jgi:glyoxalase superfamily protein
MRTQVAFDCADPHAQARFWAEVFGTEVEDHHDLVEQLVAAGRMPAEERIEIDGRSAFRDVAAVRDPSGVEPRYFFQRVPEGNRCEDVTAAAALARV